MITRVLILVTIVSAVSISNMVARAQANQPNINVDLVVHSNTTSAPKKIKQKKIFNENPINKESVAAAFPKITSTLLTKSATEIINSTTSISPQLLFALPAIIATTPKSLTPLTNTPPTKATSISAENPLSSSKKYCLPSLCEFYNGSHTIVKPHIACNNSGNFDSACGPQPHLLRMTPRRRNLILDLHNLARSRIACGQVKGYMPASHMPQLKWDNELEYLASLNVKRCRFQHDSCHNTVRFPYSGQNIGYFWKGSNITSHSKRMKNLIVNWYKEEKDANQSFIDSFHLHPDKKVIGHFTAMIGDRTHYVGCAVIRFYESNLTNIIMTCNYDYNNFVNESIYHKGPTASKCSYKMSNKHPGLCDWKDPSYEYEIEA